MIVTHYHADHIYGLQTMRAAGAVIDTDLDPLPPDATLRQVTTHFAAYNLVAVPIVDPEQRLLGAVTVDDVLDHLLPVNWREEGGA